jgi:hypothetical protein
MRISCFVFGAFNIVRKFVLDAFKGLERKHFLQAPQKIILVKSKRKARLKASARCISGTVVAFVPTIGPFSLFFRNPLL